MTRSDYLPASLTARASLEQSCVKRMAKLSGDYQTDDDEHMNILVPLLSRRYGSRQNLNVVELGPHATTIVAHTMAPVLRRYVGVDYSPVCVKKQTELIRLQQIVRAEARFGNTYDLDIPSNSQDVVVASCHDPLTSGQSAMLLKAYSEVARILKPDGELVLLPFDEANYDAPAPPVGTSSFTPLSWSAAPFTHFRAVEMVFSPTLFAPPRLLAVMRKNQIDLKAMTWQMQLDFYEEAERLARHVVNRWLFTAPFNEEYAPVRSCLYSWKQHALKRTVLYQGGRTKPISRMAGFSVEPRAEEDD